MLVTTREERGQFKERCLHVSLLERRGDSLRKDVCFVTICGVRVQFKER